TMEQVASKHIGLSVSSGQVRYTLHRLWNPRTQKGLLATLRLGRAAQLVNDLIKEGDQFFARVEAACDQIHQRGRSAAAKDYNTQSDRDWTVLRIRQAEL